MVCDPKCITIEPFDDGDYFVTVSRMVRVSDEQKFRFEAFVNETGALSIRID